MLSSLPVYVLYILAVVVSAVISLYTVKKVIFITLKRKIYDIPDNIRKIHGAQIPSLGGIGVFTGCIVAASFFTGRSAIWSYILISSIILFFTGIYDDIANMRPSKKLLAQLIASFITIYFANIHFEFLGMGLGLPGWAGVIFSTVACTFFINVFNFVDGIDGLACMMAILYTVTLAVLFGYAGGVDATCVTLCLLGATLGLLYYNYPPAKIYMGDTGSMLIGFIVFILSLIYLGICDGDGKPLPAQFIPQPAQAQLIITAMLFLPVFDALRVFVIRASKGISPLRADRRHLHYYLLDAGFSHAAAAWILVGTNALTIVVAIMLRNQSATLSLASITLPSIVLVIIAQRLRKNKNVGVNAQ